MSQESLASMDALMKEVYAPHITLTQEQSDPIYQIFNEGAGDGEWDLEGKAFLVPIALQFARAGMTLNELGFLPEG